MRKGKFISMLRHLTSDEVVEFGKFLKQYHTKDKTALRLFQYVCAHAPDFDHDNLSLNHTYQEIYKARLPESPLETRNKMVKKLLNKLSELSLCLEDFLWYQKINARSLERDLIWSTILMERGMYAELSKHRPELKKRMNGNLPGDVLGYLKQLIASYLTNYRFSEFTQNPDPDLLLDFIKHLDSFYAIIRIKLACEMATRNEVKPKTNGKPEKVFEIDKLMALLPFPHIQNNPLVAIYAELFALITKKKEKSYEKVKVLLKENLESITPEEQYAVLVFLENYAANQIRLGNTAYLSIAHNLNVFSLEQGFFAKYGIITANHYTNIINTACKARALDWAWAFAEAYSSRIDPPLSENVTKLGKAIILFEQKDYFGVLSILPNQSFSDTHCEIRARSMLLRSAWELKENSEYILSCCLAFEQYLCNRAKKDKSEAITASLNFVRILKKMVRRHKNKAQLTTEIKNLKPLYFREWLLKQSLL